MRVDPRISNERCQFKIYIGYLTSNNNKWPKCPCRYRTPSPDNTCANDVSIFLRYWERTCNYYRTELTSLTWVLVASVATQPTADTADGDEEDQEDEKKNENHPPVRPDVRLTCIRHRYSTHQLHIRQQYLHCLSNLRSTRLPNTRLPSI